MPSSVIPTRDLQHRKGIQFGLSLLPAVLLVSLLLFVEGCAGSRAGRGLGWEKLGSRTVDFGGDRDTIVVTGREGTFSRVRIEVEKSPLEMFDITLTFGDGSRWSPKTRLLFRKGEWSRTIDLPGGKRVIRKVEFRYASRGRASGKARMHVFGRH